MEKNENAADVFVSEMNAWHGRTLGLKTVEALRRNRFDAHFFETRQEAAEAVRELMKHASTVAFGGSLTARQLDLQQIAAEEGTSLLDHNAEGLSAAEKLRILKKQQLADLFICSSNAISLQGELYNVDGTGNRVSAMAFGPERVVVVAGVNKICPDEESAWLRVRNVAAPINFKRLNRPNPCTRQGICVDCNLPTRGCNIYVATRKKPAAIEFSVYIINEILGF